MLNKRLYAWKDWTIPPASLKHSNPFWGHFRESFCSKALYDYSSMARVRTLRQHQNIHISVLHALYLFSFKLVIISSQASLQPLWWQITLLWKMSKDIDSAPGVIHDLHAVSMQWGRFLKLP